MAKKNNVNKVQNVQNNKEVINDNIVKDEIFDASKDVDIIKALDDILLAKQYQKKSKQLIDSAKKIIDNKLLSKNIKKAYTDNANFQLSEFSENVLDREMLKECNEALYNLCCHKEERTRYLVTERA